MVKVNYHEMGILDLNLNVIDL